MQEFWLGGGDENLTATLLLCFFPFALKLVVKRIWRIFLGGHQGSS